jgi:hypothetical protein
LDSDEDMKAFEEIEKDFTERDLSSTEYIKAKYNLKAKIMKEVENVRFFIKFEGDGKWDWGLVLNYKISLDKSCQLSHRSSKCRKELENLNQSLAESKNNISESWLKGHLLTFLKANKYNNY